MTKSAAEFFLIENNCSNLVLTNTGKKPYRYASDLMESYIKEKSHEKIKQREAIAIEALEFLDKHYDILLGRAPLHSAAWQIVKNALENIRLVGNE